MGLDRSTVQQHYNAVVKKLGMAAVATPQTEQLRNDRRGQADVAEGDDKRT